MTSTSSFGTHQLSDGQKLGVGEHVGLPPLETVEEISAWLESQNIEHDTLGQNFASQPLIRIRKGGGPGRPIVITAGAHAGEPSGVLAALLLARDHDFKAPTYIVPLRDPFAWQAFPALLQRIAERETTAFSDHEGAAAALRAVGETLHDNGSLLVVDVNGVAFANMKPADPPIGPRQLEQALNVALADSQELAAKLVGKRVVFPSNAGPVAEGVEDYLRSFSATVRGRGIVADMNRGFGGSEEPTEVELLRAFVDEVNPGLVIDLHEGQGSTYYVFVGAGSPHPETLPYARAVLEAMGSDGSPPVTLDDLEVSFGPRIREGLTEDQPGLLVGRVQNTALDGTSFGNYCDKYCPAITTETGRWGSLTARVERQLAAVRAILTEYESA